MWSQSSTRTIGVNFPPTHLEFPALIVLGAGGGFVSLSRASGFRLDYSVGSLQLDLLDGKPYCRCRLVNLSAVPQFSLFLFRPGMRFLKAQMFDSTLCPHTVLSWLENPKTAQALPTALYKTIGLKKATSNNCLKDSNFSKIQGKMYRKLL